MSLKTRFQNKKIVVMPGVYDGLTASLAEAAGFEALYLSGAAVAYTRLGRPDIGLTTASEMADTMTLIADRTSLPVIIDADTGFGGIGFGTQLIDFLRRLYHGLEDHAQRNFFGLVQGGGNFPGMFCYL